MKLRPNSKRKILLIYFVVTTTVIFGFQNWTEDGIHPNSSIYYAILCPVLFFAIRYNLVFKISAYVETKYPDLMKKNTLGSSGFRASTINLFGINKKEFWAKNDAHMNELIKTHSFVTTLLFTSFGALVFLSFVMI